MTKLWAIGLGAALSLAFACEPMDDAANEDGIVFETSANALCNATTPCDAAPDFAQSTVPASMDPGEKRNVIVAMTNTGVGLWDTTSIRLYSRHTPTYLWGTPYENVNPTIDPGETSLHPLVIEA